MPSDPSSHGSMPRRPSVLLIGDQRHRDFCDAVLWLDQHCRLQAAADLDAAHRTLLHSPSPQIVLFAQSRPGQFAQADIETIHARSPLSRLVVLLGSWCEGEMRTGKPWTGVVRIYWHQWAARMIPELTGDNSAGGGVWQLPRTASGTEQFAQATEGPWPRGQGLVVIHSRLFCDYQALSDACRAGGYSSTWDRPGQTSFAAGASCVLCSLIGGDPHETVVAASLVHRHAPAPVIVLLDFLRFDDRRRMLDAGAAATLAKPLLVSDLLWHIDHHQTGRQSASVL